MNPITHPSFKKLCGWCGNVKLVIKVGEWEFKRCLTCDYAEIPEMH